MNDFGVFSDDFVQELVQRYDKRPASYRPDFYFVATSEDRQGLRIWIEREVQRLPEPGRTKIISRLRKDANFVTAMNELAVASVLHDAGLKATYELEVGGVTPDLFVEKATTGPAMMIEVWTRQPPAGEGGRRRGWEALRERIAKIPVPVGLVLEPHTRRRRHPERSEVGEIGRGLQDWLLRAHRPPGATVEVRGYRFRVAGPSPNEIRAYLARPQEGGTVDTGLVLQVIQDKARKYRQVAHDLGAAFMIVLAAEPGTPLDRATVEAALAGKHVLTFLVPPAPVGPLGDVTTQIPRNEQLPILDPALSAVGWLTSGLDEPTLTIFDSPTAAVAFPDLSSSAIDRRKVAG